MTNEERQARRRAYYQAHKEELKAKQKEYRKTHKAEIKAYNESRKEKMKVYQKEYRDTHKEYFDNYREEHKHDLKSYRRHHNSMFAFVLPEEKELIENYELAKKDNFDGWCIHHRLETHTSDGIRRETDISVDELQALGMYYNRPANELIFLTSSEHSILHRTGKTMSEETKNKISKANSKNGNYKTKNSEAVARYEKKHKEWYTKKINEYYTRRCLYEGKEYSYNALVAKFRKLGFEHPNTEANKYVIK